MSPALLLQCDKKNDLKNNSMFYELPRCFLKMGAFLSVIKDFYHSLSTITSQCNKDDLSDLTFYLLSCQNHSFLLTHCWPEKKMLNHLLSEIRVHSYTQVSNPV